MGEYLLRTEGVGKNFGSIVALDHVDFAIKPGEVMGVIGDNGAGKSTFIKTLSGVHKASKGYIYFEDRLVSFENPRQAIEAGIETVYQDLALAPHLDVVSNIYLGRETLREKGLSRALGILDRPAMRARTKEVLDRLKITIHSVTQTVGTLSGGQRQAVAIARVIAWGSKLVILDEPTAALGVEESEKVLHLIREVASQGVAVILISHTLPHVMKVCDKMTIFRLGRSVATVRREDTTLDELVMWITGSKTADTPVAAKEDSGSPDTTVQ
ncbi:MAG: ATP-binding cassette domain-containing protein [Christensenellales bacterium]|jgi:simple sugar transport system ATP-binding protein